MKRQWNMLEPDPARVKRLRRELGCSSLAAAILANRGLHEASAAKRFLSPSLRDLRSPFALRDMGPAVERIHRALCRRERILIHGDYDADGIAATALLVDFLRRVGADVTYHIPHRILDGYGMKAAFVRRQAVPAGIRLIVTVDCGSSDHEAVEAARDAGVDVVVTDHHLPSEPYPRAVAFINPNRRDCTGGMPHLAGAGVAFYLLVGLRQHLREKGFPMGPAEPNLKRRCDLVALGTVADLAPMVEENRILVHTGLDCMRTPGRKGLRALMESCGMEQGFLDESDIAFRLAPRLNAPGRMAHAGCAVELLLGDDPERAREAARELEGLNRTRREVEEHLYRDIRTLLDQQPNLLQRNALVLSGATWHEGVLGIVAARLARRHLLPVVLISTRNGSGKGSARTSPGVDLFRAVAASADHLKAFGGHAAAAGIGIEPESIDGFRNAFDAAVGLQVETAAPASLDIDGVLRLADITPALLNELEALRPYGEGNPEPLFAVENVRVCSWETVGGAHRRLRLCDGEGASGRPVTAMQFRAGNQPEPGQRFARLAFRVRWNHWKGRRSPQMILTAAETAAPAG
jgi:single-stranded-DNA-specific exonuclease